MLIKQLLLILRNLWRFKLYSLLNLVGLAIAMAVATLIYIYVREELSFDRQFPDAERIVRIANYNHSGPRARNWANGAPLMAEHIPEYVPEFRHITRMRPLNDAMLEYYKDSNNVVSQYDAGGFFVDSSFRDVFGVRIIHGAPSGFLTKPGSLVLTVSLSEKIFGDEIPLGKTIYLRGEPWEITAICQDFPEQQHFHPSFFASWENFKNAVVGAGLSDLYYSHGWSGVYTYALLEENTKPEDLRPKLDSFRADFYSVFEQDREAIIAGGEFVLQPLLDIHLKSHLEQEIEPNGNIVYVLVAILAAVFILIIAGVNYVNLAIVKAFKRMREVGIRKVNGAFPRQLLFQFMGESFFMAFLAGLAAVFTMDMLLEKFNQITGMQIESLDLVSFRVMGTLIVFILLLALMSGIYPAIFASRINTLQAFRDLKEPGSLTNRIRMGLVILQFTFSVFMIFSTIIIFRQMDYFFNKNMGWNKENIIALTLNGPVAGMAIENPDMLKDELKKLAFVESLSLVSHLPGDRFSVEGLQADVPREDDFSDPAARFLRVDEDFITLMGIEITEGRDLRRTTGINSEFILNREAVRLLELKDPVGTRGTTYFGQQGEIVGVSGNFNYASLLQEIEPLVLEVNYDPEFRRLWSGYLLIRISPGDISDKVDRLETALGEVAEGFIMDYTFLEDNMNKNYQAEERLETLLNTFAILAILISCLGLFGLSAFSAEIRTKEMGVRKALGSSVAGIVFLMSKNFIYYVIVALLIGLPAGYYFMNNWLRNFAFHINIAWWEFVLAATLAVIITLFSVSYQAIKSGKANPVDSLRYE